MAKNLKAIEETMSTVRFSNNWLELAPKLLRVCLSDMRQPVQRLNHATGGVIVTSNGVIMFN